MLRIARGARILQRWELKISINYAALQLLRVVAMVLLYLHWSACVWAMQHSVQSSVGLEHTWLGAQNYCVHEGDEIEGYEYTESVPMGFDPTDSDSRVWICRQPWPMVSAAGSNAASS